jgi:hypothetical protein
LLTIKNKNKMKKTLLIIPVFLLSLNLIYGQFIVKNVMFQPTGVSNQGLVVGYETQAGPYSIWKPDSTITVNIGGLAPGNGIGSQAHFSDDGNFLSGTSYGTKGAEMSRYNKTTHQWSVVGSLGFVVDSTVGGGFGISGDGNTVVGLSWADTTGGFAYAHALAWNQLEGIMDLGSLHDSIHASARANAASYDGSVIVGWQDFNGPWKSAVWRKKPGGGYFPNKYLLIDSTGSPTDEFNQLGECSSVSANGIWIGGYGDYANNGEPWIWSADSGVINLGVLPGGSTGYVASIDSDGSMAVGWFDGQLFGDPQVPFIWTRTGGLQNLNNYIHNTLGLSTGAIQVNAANCMSSNGKYIAGYGVDTSTFNYFTYRVSAIPSGINEINETPNVSIYPNPFASQATIDFSEDEWHNIIILDLLGKEIKTIDFSGKQLVLQKEEMREGIYFVRITDSKKNIVTRKIIIQ